MLDLIKIASELSSTGTVVNIDVKMWDGALRNRPEWGNVYLKLLPENLFSSISEIKKKIIGNLNDYSIPCKDGFFVPDFVFSDWFEKHNLYLEMYYKSRGMIMECHADLIELARSVAAHSYVESWNKYHPSEVFPPPSGKSQASNLAASMVPEKEKFYDLYKIESRFNQHSFSFISSNPKNLPIDQGTKREMAWHVVDELVASNARRLANDFNQIISNITLHGNKARYTLNSTRLFLNTDIFSSNCLREKVQTLFDLIKEKTFSQIDQNEFNLAFEEVRVMALKLSNVSGIMGFLQ